MQTRVIILALCVVLSACGGSDSAESEGVVSDPSEPATSTTTSTTTTTTEVETTRAETKPPPAPETRTLTVDKVERSYLLFVPSDLDPGEPVPLVLNLHGFGGIANQLVAGSQFNVVAEAEGIIVAYPNALGGQGFGEPPAWKFDDDSDVTFMNAIIDDVSSTLSVDPTRLYAIGFSQGGDFSASLPCRDPGRFAAVASVAVLNHHTTPTCAEDRAAPVLAFVGTADPGYSIDEGLTIDVPDPDPPGPLAEEAGDWAATNQCSQTPHESEPVAGVVRQLYDCESGALVIYIHSGEHVWPQSDTEGINASRLIWDFLSGHSL